MRETAIRDALIFAFGLVGFVWAVSRFFRYSKQGQMARDHAALMRDIERLEENELLRNWPE